MSKFFFLCFLSFSYAMAWSQSDHNGLKHISGNRWDNDYSIEVYYASVGHDFNHIPDANTNPFWSQSNSRTLDAYGFGVAFSKTLNSKARIMISPAIYISNNKPHYDISVGGSGGLYYMQNGTYDLHGFNLPISYVSYFKTPKRRVSFYWIGAVQFSQLKLTTYSTSYQNNFPVSYSSEYKHNFAAGFAAGIGIDLKLSKRWYSYSDGTFGVDITDGSTNNNSRFGLRYNFFKE